MASQLAALEGIKEPPHSPTLTQIHDFATHAKLQLCFNLMGSAGGVSSRLSEQQKVVGGVPSPIINIPPSTPIVVASAVFIPRNALWVLAQSICTAKVSPAGAAGSEMQPSIVDIVQKASISSLLTPGQTSKDVLHGSCTQQQLSPPSIRVLMLKKM